MNHDTIEKVALDYPFSVNQLRGAATDLTEIELRKLCMLAWQSETSPEYIRSLLEADEDIHAVLSRIEYDSRFVLHDAMGELKRELRKTFAMRFLWCTFFHRRWHTRTRYLGSKRISISYETRCEKCGQESIEKVWFFE